MTESSNPFTRLALIPGLAVAMVLASLALATPVHAKKIRADFFGMHDSQIANANGSVPTVRLGSIRLWDSGTSWREIERMPGDYDWSAVDRAVDNARSAGLRPMLVLGQTPQFRTEDLQDSTTPGAYGDGASSPPNIDAWKAYVKAAADRYDTRVDYQIWNEPNVINYWSGSVGEMARLTATGSRAITQGADGKGKPTVVAPSFPLRLGSQQKWFKKYWSAKVGGKSVASYVDVVSVNPYPLPDQGPEASPPLIRFAKGVLPKAAKRKPMWNTEINYGLAQGGSGESRGISAAKQAAFVGRTLLLNAGSGIRRVYWYTWAGDIGNTRLVESDRVTLTRAGKAWQEVRGWLVGTNVKSCKKVAKGVYTCTARESRREVRRFYWKPTGKAVSIRTHKTTTKWTNLAGNTTTKKGSFRLKVGQSPVMVTSRR